MIYQNGNKWIYEHNGEIVASEYTYEGAKACGEARVKAMQSNTASSGLACTCKLQMPFSNNAHAKSCPLYYPARR